MQKVRNLFVFFSYFCFQQKCWFVFGSVTTIYPLKHKKQNIVYLQKHEAPAHFSKFKCEIQKEAKNDRIDRYKESTHLHFFFFEFNYSLLVSTSSIISILECQFEKKYISNPIPSIYSIRSDSWVAGQTYSLFLFYFCKLLMCEATHNIFSKDRVRKDCSLHKVNSETFLYLLIFTKIEMHKSPKNLQFSNNSLNHLNFKNRLGLKLYIKSQQSKKLRFHIRLKEQYLIHRYLNVFFVCREFNSKLLAQITFTCHTLVITLQSFMSKVTLGFWKTRGRGQIPRLLLSYTGTKFEDRMYDKQNEWFEVDKEKLHLDFPNLLYLIDGDFRLTESRAIYYYIIERAKRGEELLGKDFRERARILNVVEVVLDMLHRIEHLIYDQHSHSKREEIWKRHINPNMKRLATFRGNREFVFDRITLVDFVLAELSHFIEGVFPNEYKNLQFLHDHRQSFHSIPEIKTYYEREDAVKGPFVHHEKALIKF